MKRSLMARVLCLWALAFFAPSSQAIPGGDSPSTLLRGVLRTGMNFFVQSKEQYGFPVVGSACVKTDPHSPLVCLDQKSGLLYSPSEKFSFGLSSLGDSSLSALILEGHLIDLKGDGVLQWQLALSFTPYSDNYGAGNAVSSWSLGYNNSELGIFTLGDQMAMDAFTAFSPIMSHFGSLSSYRFAGAGDDSIKPFDYEAPGLSYKTPDWNSMSLAFSVGASIKQHQGPDGQWQNVLSSSIGAENVLKTVPKTEDTDPHAIQWAASVKGVFPFLDSGHKWALSYAQSHQLNQPGLSVLEMRRALRLAYATDYFPDSLTFVRASWTQNTGINRNNAQDGLALDVLGLQSDFDAMLVTPNRQDPSLSPFSRVQFTQPVPYWTAGVAVTSSHQSGDLSAFEVTLGYSRLQTYGYDYPGFALNRNPLYGKYLFFEGTRYADRLQQAFKFGDGVDAALKRYSTPYDPDTAYQYGRLTSQSVYLGVRYQVVSAYDLSGSLLFTVQGEMAYSKVSLQLEGTPAQQARGYSDESFDLGKVLSGRILLGVEYDF